jgi:L-threonylcarbamoyladenylate synthase
METQIIPAEEPTAIPHAADVLAHNGVVAFPTDTVYGIGALAFEEEAIERLYFIKGRSHSKAIAILISDIHELELVTPHPSKMALDIAKRFWPGPVTMILPQHPNVPDALSALPTIGVRIPDHPVALALLRETGPLGVTSANLSGSANTSSAQEVIAQLDGRVHLIIDGGATPGKVPSTVVDLTTAEMRILRQGPVTMKDLESVLA